MEKIGLPKISEQKIENNHSSFTIEPLFPGYGPTIGNALRRILLSSITGAAATSFKIDGINHEFSSIPNVKEDMIEVLMNIKSINFTSHSEEPVVVELIKKGPGEVTAADFKANSNVEIANPTQHIMSLDTKADIRMEVIVEKDRGFRLASVATGEKKEIGSISIDASFSPVVRVSLEIVDTRVGQTTNYDKLTLDVLTNGAITPKDALKEASALLVDHYNAIMDDSEFAPELTEKASAFDEMPEGINTEEVLENDEYEGKTKIEDANFSPRTANALANASIKTMAGLKRLSPLKLEEIKGLGKKGIDEINEVLGR